jgi:hypothetical protein
VERRQIRASTGKTSDSREGSPITGRWVDDEGVESPTLILQPFDEFVEEVVDKLVIVEVFVEPTSTADELPATKRTPLEVATEVMQRSATDAAVVAPASRARQRVTDTVQMQRFDRTRRACRHLSIAPSTNRHRFSLPS